MTKLLTICIPTYKRPVTLRRCIESVVSQIDKYALSECVDVYVTNDASSDDTVAVLYDYATLGYFKAVTREQNLGMNLNIKSMLIEVLNKSHYQLIITDDDYLQPDMLLEIVEFLRRQQNDPDRVSAIWTPRYSYTEDERLHCVVCNPFKGNGFVKSSSVNVGKYMNNGFVLSGLIIRAESIDYNFWEQYKENAYFPVIFFGDLLLRDGAYYWDKNITHHTVLNECHWQRWGKNDIIIRLRLFSDFVNAYAVMSKRINSLFGVFLFYCAALMVIFRHVDALMLSDVLRSDDSILADSILELQKEGVMKFNYQLRLLLVCTLILSVAKLTVKVIIPGVFSLFAFGKKRKQYRKISSLNLKSLRALSIMLKIILS